VALEVKDGMIVSPGELLLTIADTSRLQVLAEVDELDAGFIKKGQEAIITFDAFPDQQFPAHVTKIAPQAIIKGDRTIVETVVLLNDLTELLKISNQVDVKIIRDKKMGTLVLPISSVCEGSSPFVWLHRNSFISKTQVNTGLSDMDSIEITDGLQENDEVVANCRGDLKDGTKVRANKEFSTGRH
jgi:HlyD family secretion protein